MAAVVAGLPAEPQRTDAMGEGERVMVAGHSEKQAAEDCVQEGGTEWRILQTLSVRLCAMPLAQYRYRNHPRKL